MRLVLAASLAGFCGYALLLPVVPLWAARGGAGALGAGATTGALLGSTVAVQLAVPALLRRAGHRAVLCAGMLLLGLPTPLHALSSDLAPLVAVSALRGAGFALLTVAGSAVVADLVGPGELGRATARYGLAVGLPNLVLLPAGVGVVDEVGFAALFCVAGALPVVGALVVLGVTAPPATAAPRLDRTVITAAAWPWTAMVACALAQGGLVTFVPLAFDGPTVPLALLATAAGTLAGRWGAGQLADRGRAGGLLPAGVAVAAVGMLATGTPAVVAGAALVGVGFGVVQNTSLVGMLAGAAGTATASAAWNIAYDTGTGLGAVVLGAAAEPLGFDAAFAVSAAVLAAVLAGLLVRRR